MTDSPGGGQRDFLAEAAQLAAQIDTWGDFEFQDEEPPGTVQGVAVLPQWQYGAESMLAAQGAAVMRDQSTLQGTQAMCPLYQSHNSKATAQPMLKQPHLSQYFPPPVLGTVMQPAVSMNGVSQQPLPCSALSQPDALSIHMLSQSALPPSPLSMSALPTSALSQPLSQQQATLALPVQPQPLLPEELLPAARQSPRLSPVKASNLSTRSGIAEEDDVEEANLASSSGSDEAWEPSQNGHISSRLRTSQEYKGRDRSRGMQPRRRKQQQKGKLDDQRKWASLTQELRAVQAEKKSLELHASMLEKALMRLSCEGAKQKPSEPVFIPALGWKSFDPKGSIVLSVVFDQPRKLTSEQVNRISIRDHCRLWREFVVRIRECLKHVKEASDSGTPHSTKLKALLDERHGYLAFVAANNPLAVHRLTQCKVTDPPVRETEPVPAQFHSNILAKMKLSEEQRNAFVEARNKYLVGLGYHSAALARTQHEVQSLDSKPHESLRNSSYLGWVQVSRAMQEAMDEIHVCHVTLMFAIYLGPHALSPFQAGTMLVESFPYLPDIIQLVKELASDMGAPTSKELLHVGALKYQEKNGGSDIKYCAAQPYIPVVDKISELYERASIK